MTYPPPAALEDEEEQPGDTFIGHMDHGKRHGQGKYTWASGAFYEGSYANNKKQGHGLMTFPDKSKYEGMYSMTALAFEQDLVAHGVEVLNWPWH